VVSTHRLVRLTDEPHHSIAPLLHQPQPPRPLDQSPTSLSVYALCKLYRTQFCHPFNSEGVLKFNVEH